MLVYEQLNRWIEERFSKVGYCIGHAAAAAERGKSPKFEYRHEVFRLGRRRISCGLSH